MVEKKQTLDSEGNAIEYKGFPFLSNIDMYVKNELANRSLDRVANMVPYIKVTPGFSRDNSVESKIVMKGIESPALKDPSEYKFQELYRPDAFFRPLAGIKNVTVDYKNAMGSIRKATISWICHTLEDLERLSPYFLNPGYSMFIEWGWSDWAKDVIENNPPVDLGNYFTYGVAMQKHTNGNYDCMMGIVTNYSFSMNRDGGFECTTEVISSGWLMEGMTMANQHTQDATEIRRLELKEKYPNESKQQIEDRIKNENSAESDTQAKVLRTLQSFLNEEYYAVLKNHIQGGQFDDVNATHDYFILKGSGNTYQGDNAELIDKNEGLKIRVKDLYVDTDGNSVSLEVSRRAAVYATWGYFEDYILNPYITIATDDKRILFGFDSRDSKLSYHSHLRTTDLGICILPNASAIANGAAPTMNEKRGESVENEYNFAYARRILINVDYFRETMLNATTVIDGVLQLWSGINNACINYWDLKLKMNEQFFDVSENDENTIPNQQPQDRNIMDFLKKSNVYTVSYGMSDPLKSKAINRYSIMDINYASAILKDLKANPDDIYMFRTKAFKVKDKNTGVEKEVTSVVKNFTLTSKLSSMAALNVFYSAQNTDGRVLGAPQTNTFRSLYDFSIDGKDWSNATDTFSVKGLKITAGENDGLQISKDEKADDPGTTTEIELKEQRAYGDSLVKYLPWGGEEGKGYYVKIGDKNLTGIEGMRMAVLLKDGNSPAISTALVPLDCEVELQGISGIRIGNIFTVDHLPQIYKDKGVFQVIGITETIDKGAWTTKLKSQFRVFNDVEYSKIQGSIVESQRQVPTGKITRINDIDKSFVLPESKAYIVQRLRDIWTDPSIEGFIASERILKEAEIIIYKESSAKQYNFNINPPDDSYGLFQINMIKKGIPWSGGVTKYDLYSERTKWTDLGIIKDKSDVHPTLGITLTHHNLWDLDTNLKVAKRIFKNYGGKSGYSWSPWSTRVYLASNRQTTSLRNEIQIV